MFNECSLGEKRAAILLAIECLGLLNTHIKYSVQCDFDAATPCQIRVDSVAWPCDTSARCVVVVDGMQVLTIPVEFSGTSWPYHRHFLLGSGLRVRECGWMCVCVSVCVCVCLRVPAEAMARLMVCVEFSVTRDVKVKVMVWCVQQSTPEPT